MLKRLIVIKESVMEICVTDAGSYKYYEEVVNTITSYNRLVKRHNVKPINRFNITRNIAILSIILTVVAFASEFIIGRATVLGSSIIVICCFVYYFSIRKYGKYRNILSAMVYDDTSTIIIDENGVELRRKEVVYNVPWNMIIFARIFERSICFVPNMDCGFMLFIQRKYSYEVLEAIKKYNPTLEVVR